MGRNTDGLRPVTVRFSPPAWEAIRDMAHDHGVSQAELVRMAVSGNLSRYLGEVRIVDKEQAEEVKKVLMALFNATSDIGKELHRIGVNYNQEVRALNAAAKGGKGTAGREPAYPGPEIGRALERYERAAGQAGDMLCRILG